MLLLLLLLLLFAAEEIFQEGWEGGEPEDVHLEPLHLLPLLQRPQDAVQRRAGLRPASPSGS